VLSVYVNFLCSSSHLFILASISQDGRMTTNAFMAEYNQDRFELEIQAKETQPPERTTMAKVLVSRMENIKSYNDFKKFVQQIVVNVKFLF
jgi:hypothetical protein